MGSLAAIVFATVFLAACQAFEFHHHDYKQMLEVMKKTQADCPSITKLYYLPGRTTEQRQLAVIQFSTNPGKHDPGENFCYFAVFCFHMAAVSCHNQCL